MAEYPQHRPVTLARRGLVAAPHYLAAEAGLDMIKAGGNAVDAAIAANAVLQVVYPFVCGVGGDLFAMIYDAASGQLFGLNGSGRAAQAATVARYHELGHATMPQFGVHSVTVPGCVDGWEMMAQRFGRLGLARALEPAISYAEEGFAVGPGLHAALSRMHELEIAHHSWRDNFTPAGVIAAEGSMMRMPDLARTYRAIASHGADSFYRGELGEQIAGFFGREGGLITREDLAAHHGEWVTPLSVAFADLTVFELPPNTQGITALQMLGLINGLPLGEGPLAAETVHLEVEAKKVAWADRQAYLTDLAHMRVDPVRLIMPEYLVQRQRLIDPARASSTVASGKFSGDTIYLCAGDGAGNLVSLIQSNYMGFGSGLVVDGTGIALQNRGAYFSLDPNAANAIAPGKRTLHTLIPSIALRDGRPAVVFGTMGGDGQAQTHLQVYTALARFGMNIQAAIELPRWIHGAVNADEGAVLRVENRFPAATLDGLQQRGHTITEIGAWDAQMGYAQGIIVDATTGVLRGGSDPRAEGVAAGW